MSRKQVFSIGGLWLAWVVILLGFQELAPARLQLATPDYALFWTPDETRPHSQDSKPFLVEPVLNRHVAWDSEFYLAIATGGYDDPRVRLVGDINSPLWVPRLAHPLSMSYAFMPFYPLVMRGVALP